MELIIKVEETCNFWCTFCSSSNLVADNNKQQQLDFKYIEQFFERFPDTNTIIFNGGDPLMVPIEYHWKLLNFLDDNNYKATISYTSNLWPFYKNPDKWTPIFKHPRVGVTTSFNYGDTRRITKNRVYTEEDFWDVSDTMLKYVGYRPDFISVITDENEDTAIDNVRLAKRMNVECKLNYAMASGRQGIPFQLSKMYAIYLDVIEEGLGQWEFNCRQLVKRLSGGGTCCPQNRDCDSGIRALQPDGDYYSCGSLGDDKVYPLRFVDEVIDKGPIQTPLSNDINMDSMHTGCYSCPNFLICNGCRKTIRDHKQANMVEEHCILMKTLTNRISEVQGMDLPEIEGRGREFID